MSRRKVTTLLLSHGSRLRYWSRRWRENCSPRRIHVQVQRYARAIYIVYIWHWEWSETCRGFCLNWRIVCATRWAAIRNSNVLTLSFAESAQLAPRARPLPHSPSSTVFLCPLRHSLVQYTLVAMRFALFSSSVRATTSISQNLIFYSAFTLYLSDVQ